MDPAWAAENLQVIRTLMERAALYRRALAPVALTVGAIGMFAGLGGVTGWGPLHHVFAPYWLMTAAVAFIAALFIMRRQALRDGEPFWSPPTVRVVQACLPAWLTGLMLGVLAQSDPALATRWLPGLWMMLYGCGLHAAGFFMQRGVRFLGLQFLVVGLIALILTQNPAVINSVDRLRLAHGLMGAVFGGLHLLYGIYLAVTERRGRAA